MQLTMFGGMHFRPWRDAAAALVVALLAGCGGTGNPLDNPAQVSNSAISSAQTLCFAYYQRCVNPIFLTPLPVLLNNVPTVNTCGAAGCHDNATGTGGAFRIIPSAAVQDLNFSPTNPGANTPTAVRASDMYKNFLSAEGEILFTAPLQSRLLLKPQVQGVLHGGGLIFDSANSQDPNVKVIRYWIEHPAQLGQDEFGASCAAMFTPADTMNGACNTN